MNKEIMGSSTFSPRIRTSKMSVLRVLFLLLCTVVLQSSYCSSFPLCINDSGSLCP